MMDNKTVISRFRAWLNNIPIKDRVNRQMSALLQVMLLGLITASVTATLVNLFLTTDRNEILIQGVLNTSIFAIPLILLRRGFFRISISYLIALFLILVTTAILATDLRSEADTLIFFTLGILLAGLLLGRRALIFTFAVSAAIVLYVAVREQDLTLRLDYISIAGNFILLNGLMSFFVNSFGITLRNSLRASLQREEEINLLNEQLQNQVAELERFTYTVSHDLRSPLVTIKGFLGMLNQDIDKDRSDKIESDIERIAGATDKMDELLSDLLELSRIGRVNNPPVEIDSAELLQEALDNVDFQIRANRVTVKVESIAPVLFGDRIRLREVFENLIENAVKYTQGRDNPLIEIGMRNQEQEQVIYVRDNGMGIEKKYLQKIFELFEKLNPLIEGTGIGLALVKRIIETHGGRVWAESDGLGTGTTICFTIPDGRNNI